MKKLILATLLVVIIVLSVTVIAFAESADDEYKGIYEAAQSATEELLDEAGIDGVDYSELISLSPARLFEIIKQLFVGTSHTPLRTAAGVIAILIAFSVINSFNTGRLGDEDYYSFIENALIVFAVIVPLSDSLSLAAGAIVSASNFMFSFIPVFTALVSASGKPASSFLYSASMLSFASLCDGFCSKIVLPSVGVITSLNIFSALDSNIRISRVTSSIKKILTVTLSISASLFVGLTNLKATLAGSADSLALKGVRTAAGAFVPVIGSALGDAVNSALGAMGLIKSTLGVFGIIALALTFAPCAVELLIWYFSLTVCSLVASAVGQKGSSEILESILGCISIVNTVLVLCALVFVLTTGHLLRG